MKQAVTISVGCAWQSYYECEGNSIMKSLQAETPAVLAILYTSCGIVATSLRSWRAFQHITLFISLVGLSSEQPPRWSNSSR